jgi:hypothetical protein
MHYELNTSVVQKTDTSNAMFFMFTQKRPKMASFLGKSHTYIRHFFKFFCGVRNEKLQ